MQSQLQSTRIYFYHNVCYKNLYNFQDISVFCLDAILREIKQYIRAEYILCFHVATHYAFIVTKGMRTPTIETQSLTTDSLTLRCTVYHTSLTKQEPQHSMRLLYVPLNERFSNRRAIKCKIHSETSSNIDSKNRSSCNRVILEQ